MGAGGGRLWTTGASGTPYPASRALEQARKDPIRTYKKNKCSLSVHCSHKQENIFLTKHLMLLVALFQAVLRLSEGIWPWTTYLTV